MTQQGWTEASSPPVFSKAWHLPTHILTSIFMHSNSKAAIYFLLMESVVTVTAGLKSSSKTMTDKARASEVVQQVKGPAYKSDDPGTYITEGQK